MGDPSIRNGASITSNMVVLGTLLLEGGTPEENYTPASALVSLKV